MLAEYCARGEMQKLEHELWKLKMKGFDVSSYTTRFCDLALLYLGMVTPESKKIERYIWGLTPPMQGNVLAARPATFDSAKCLVQTLIDHEVDLDKVTATPEPAKVSSEKRNLWKQ